MADRYLLESGAPDGYQLEDGSGVLLLETPSPALDDGSDSWWAGVQRGFVSVPLAGAAAALSLSVAISTGINRHNDEIIPYQPSEASSRSVSYGQRARHQTQFVRWYQNDDLPVAAAATPALDDGGWSQWRPPLASPNGIIWATDEGSIPAAVPEEDYWWKAERVSSLPAKPLAWAEDDLPVAAGVTPALDEGEWRAQFQQSPPQVRIWSAEDDLPVQAAATLVEEEYALALPAAMAEPKALPVITTDEIFPSVVVVVEEDYQLEFRRTSKDQSKAVAFLSDDEIGPSVVEEEYSYQPPVQRVAPVSRVSVDEEIVPQPAPLAVEDEYWLTFTLGPSVAKVTILNPVEDDLPELSAPTPAPEPEFVYRGHRNRHEVDYETVVKQWELLELRRAQAKRKPDAESDESLDSVSPDPLAPAAEADAPVLSPVLSPLLKIDLDAILSRHKFHDAVGEVERASALRAAIAEVEETELLILMAIAAAEDDE